MSSTSVICIGAGPAGLTAAYLLSKQGVPVTVLERDAVYVGGISRTASYKGFLFDIGGHRFFSKSQEVEDLWDEILDRDFLDRPRKSRIYYNRRLFEYPLKVFDALPKLGLWEAARCVFSYAQVRLRPAGTPQNFRDWVTARFGKRLFEIFFRTYTEKVWGMKCEAISADWAAQRIKGLSLSKAIWHALRPQRSNRPRKEVIKTLVDSFRYPARGPGMLWDCAADKTRLQGGAVHLGQQVSSIARLECGTWQVTTQDTAGSERTYCAEHVISTMPMRELAAALTPGLPAHAMQAANGLRYRDFLMVALILKDRQVFDDNWIYIHAPEVKVGRIQNFKSWSPEMVPDSALNCLGLEYFCFEGDGLWDATDAELVALATRELIQLGLAAAEDVIDGTVVRQAKAYPIYDADYQTHVTALRETIAARCPGLHLVGRNGMHKYNNQDHAMMTAMLTVKNILAGRALYDIWQVNQDADYHEEVHASARTPLEPGRRAALLSERAVPVAVGSD